MKFILPGTSQELGEDMFIKAMMPVIRVQAHGMSPQNLANLYVGIIGAAYGSMAADFGKESAQQIIDMMQKQFGTVFMDTQRVIQ
jgi:CheY-specific phosphatase CheX